MNRKIKLCIYTILSIMLLTIPVMTFAEEENNPDPSPTPSVSPTPTPTEIEVEGISLNKDTIPSLYVDETITLTATITPSDATNKELTWTSSNSEVATVDEKGVVKGIKAGKATITVKSNNGKSSSCEVTVVNKEEVKKSSEALIKKLTIKNGTIEPSFKSNTYKYTVNVENTVTSLDFDLTLSTGASSMKANNNNIKTGTIVKIVVTSEDKENTTTYEFAIKKAKGNANLKSLSIKGYTLNESFSADRTEYTADIPYEATDVTIQAACEDASSKVKITGATDLIVGKNTVVVTVTDTSGNEKEYKIIVNRGALEERETTSNTSKYSSTSNLLDSTSHNDSNTKNHTLRYIIVTTGSLILVLIGGIGIYFYKATSTKEKKKKQKGNKKVLKEKTSEEDIESPLIEANQEPTSKKPTSIMPGDLTETREFRIEDLNENNQNQKVKEEIDDLFDDE